jgi:hypothetical protein
MERQITTTQIVKAETRSARASIYVSMPGAVVKYYPDDQTADVQPMVNDVRFDVETGEIVFEPWSVIQRVPVSWPRMAGGFVIAGFLEEHDQVVLEAFDLDPSPWRAQGRSSNPVNPGDVRRLGGNYWRAEPTDLTGPIGDAPTAQGMVIGQDGQPAQIVVTPGKIQLGRSGGDFVSLASKVDSAISNIISAFNGHTHVVTGTLTPPTAVAGTAAAPAVPIPSQSSTGSTLIAAQ